jgi:hypothetical protein
VEEIPQQLQTMGMGLKVVEVRLSMDAGSSPPRAANSRFSLG